MSYRYAKGIHGSVKRISTRFINLTTASLFFATTFAGASPLLFASTAHATGGTTNITLYNSAITPPAGSGLYGTNSSAFVGNGSWENDQTAGKAEYYLPISSLGSFTIGDISNISFSTKRLPADTTGFDYVFNLYTAKGTSNNEGSWYGHRITVDPMYSSSYNSHSTNWTTWDTDGSGNTATVYDSFKSAYGWYGGGSNTVATLADLQSGPINWKDYLSTAPNSSIDYSGDVVKYIAFSTGSAWNTNFAGLIDGINIILKNGTELKVDLENNQPPAAPTNLYFTYGNNGHRYDSGDATNRAMSNGSLHFHYSLTGNDSDYSGVRVAYKYPGDGDYRGTHFTWPVENNPNSLYGFSAHGEGVYTYKVQVRSTNGVWSDYSAPATIIYDKTDPSVTWTLPAANSYIDTDNDLTVGGTYSDGSNGSGINRINLYVSKGNGYSYSQHNPAPAPGHRFKVTGLTVGSTSGSFTYTIPHSEFVALGIGNGDTFTVTAVPFDQANNGSLVRDNLVLNSDTIAPKAPVITKPTPEQYFNASPILDKWDPVTTQADGSSLVSGINHYEIAYNYDNGHDFAEGNPSWTTMTTPTGYNGVTRYTSTGTNTSRNHNPASWEQGGVTIWVRAVDNAGNVSAWSAPVHYYYDHTAPDAPALVSPHDGAIVHGSSITQSWSDTSGDVDHYIYESYNDAGATSLRWHQEYSGTSKTATNVGESTYWWRVKAVDHAGNTSGWSPLWKITVDDTAPTVKIDAPSNGAVVNHDVDIYGTVTDANPHHYWLQIKKNGTVIYSHTTNDSSSFTNQLLKTVSDEGNYEVTLAARDAAGGTSTSGNRSGNVVVSFTIDKTVAKPTIVSNNDMNSAGVETFTIGDIENGASLDVELNGTPANSSSSVNNNNGTYTLTVDMTDYVNVDLTITAQQTDLAGNVSGQAELTVKKPDIESEQSASTTNTGSLTIHWTTDELSTSRVVYDTVPHGTINPNDPNFGYQFTTPITDTNPKVTDHTVVLTGLQTNKIYYFRVVSHGSPIAVSGEHHFQAVAKTNPNNSNTGSNSGNSSNAPTISNVSATPTPANNGGTAGQVQGASTTTPSNQNKEVKGAHTNTPSEKLGSTTGKDATSGFNYNWLWLLLILLVPLYFLVTKKSDQDDKN